MSDRERWPHQEGAGHGGRPDAAAGTGDGARPGAVPTRPAMADTAPTWPGERDALTAPGSETAKGAGHRTPTSPLYAETEPTPPTWPAGAMGAVSDRGPWYGSGSYGPPPGTPPGYGAGGYGAGGYGPTGYGGGGYRPPPYGPPPSPQRHVGPPTGRPSGTARGRALRSAAGVLVVVAAAAAGAGISRVAWPASKTTGGAFPSSGTSNPTAPGSAAQGSSGSAGQGSGGPANVAAIAAAVDPAIVDVNVSFGYNNAAGAGTGMVLSPDGLVLTNNHVIDESTKVSATDIGNGRTYSATVLGYDNIHDVALLQLQGASGLATVKIASSPAAVGQQVVAIGNAGGTGGAPSSASGTVIALHQDITASDALTHTSENLSDMIETDAAIQEGDSGGPLVNTAGAVIGMDTAALASFAFAQQGTQGFSIPIDRALAIAHAIEAGKGTSDIHVGATAWMGLQLVSAGSSNTFQFPNGSPTTQQPATSATGLEVYQSVSGTPAAQAGLAQGDILTSLNGTSLTSFKQLSHLMTRYHPGDKVKVAWVTPTGQPESATITLASGPPD